jgi:hypothetical protein
MRDSEYRRKGLRVALCASLAIGSASGADAAKPAARVRSTDSRILELIKEGVERSATFCSLVDAIDHSDGIIYVEFGHCAFGHLNACLLPFIAAAHGDRYLRILVTPDRNRRSHDQLLALIAHELRHALEVIADRDVVDLATMEAMYRRIGMPVAGMTGYETSAARAAGDAVLSELSANRLKGCAPEDFETRVDRSTATAMQSPSLSPRPSVP